MFATSTVNRLSHNLGKYVGEKIGRKSHTNNYVKLGVVVGIAASVGFVAREIYRRM